MARLEPADSKAAAAAFLEALRAWDFLVLDEWSERFRVSKRGTVLIDEQPVLTHDVLERAGLAGETQVERAENLKRLLTEMLSPCAVRALHDALVLPKGKARFPKIGLENFVVGKGMELPEKGWTAFEAAHVKYSGTLKAQAEKLLAGLDLSLFGSLGLLRRTECQPEQKDVVASVDARGVWVAECRKCGFTAAFAPKSWVWLNGDCRGSDVFKDGAELLNRVAFVLAERLRRSDEFREADRLCAALEEEMAARVPCARAQELLFQLKILTQSVRESRVEWRDGAWMVMPFRVPPEPAAVLERCAEAVEEARSLPAPTLSEAREMALRFWEKEGGLRWESVRRLHAELPPLLRLAPRVEQAWNRLESFVSALKAGRFETRDRQVCLGSERMSVADEASLGTALAELICEFEGVARGPGGEVPSFDVAVEVLKLVAARPKEMGTTTVAAVLAGSKARKVLERKYDKLPQYGVLKGRCSQAEVVRAVEKLAEMCLVSVVHVGWHDLPVLHLPKAVREAVRSGALSAEPEDGARLLERAERAARKRGWDELAEMASEGYFPARAALAAAAALWPSGGAARLLTGAV